MEDSTWERVLHGNPGEERFKFNTFAWTDSLQSQVFVHCEVLACPNTESDVCAIPGTRIEVLYHFLDLFRLYPPPPVIEHVPLHRKSSCKNMTRASGVANNMSPLRGGAQTEKIRFFFTSPLNYNTGKISTVKSLNSSCIG